MELLLTDSNRANSFASLGSASLSPTAETSDFANVVNRLEPLAKADNAVRRAVESQFGKPQTNHLKAAQTHAEPQSPAQLLQQLSSAQQLAADMSKGSAAEAAAEEENSEGVGRAEDQEAQAKLLENHKGGRELPSSNGHSAAQSSQDSSLTDVGLADPAESNATSQPLADEKDVQQAKSAQTEVSARHANPLEQSSGQNQAESLMVQRSIASEPFSQDPKDSAHKAGSDSAAVTASVDVKAAAQASHGSQGLSSVPSTDAETEQVSNKLERTEAAIAKGVAVDGKVAASDDAKASATAANDKPVLSDAAKASGTAANGQVAVSDAAKASGTAANGQAAVSDAAKASATAANGQAAVSDAAKASGTAANGQAAVSDAAKASATAANDQAAVSDAAKASATTANDQAVASDDAKARPLTGDSKSAVREELKAGQAVAGNRADEREAATVKAASAAPVADKTESLSAKPEHRPGSGEQNAELRGVTQASKTATVSDASGATPQGSSSSDTKLNSQGGSIERPVADSGLSNQALVEAKSTAVSQASASGAKAQAEPGSVAVQSSQASLAAISDSQQRHDSGHQQQQSSSQEQAQQLAQANQAELHRPAESSAAFRAAFTAEPLARGELNQQPALHQAQQANQLADKGALINERLNPSHYQAPAELNQRVQYMLSQGMQKAEIRLDPAELGSMHVRLQMNQEQQVSVHIQVQNPQAREALEQTMPRLREMLQQQGIELAQGHVNQQHQGGSSQQGQQQSLAGGRAEQRAVMGDGGEQELSTSPRKQASSDGIDFYA